MRISLSCKVKQYIRVLPNNRVNLMGFEGEKLKQTVIITSFEEQPLEITDITSTVDDKIDYKLKTKKKGEEYVIEVKNRSKEADSFTGKMIVKTNSQKKPHIVLSVSGRMKTKVAVRPEIFTFGTIDTHRENFESLVFKRRVMLMDAKGEGFTVKKVKTSSKWIKAELESKKERDRYAVQITLDKDKLPKGKLEEEVRIYTSYQRKPLVVNIRGNVI
jgi:hypothetical protein